MGLCWHQRGKRAVTLDFRGRRYLIGSEDTEALLWATLTAGAPRGRA